MSRFVPWLLVSLCFVLGVASRSISDTFPVFVPALERGFGAARGDVTVIYSFALLVGGISGPVNGWILDRLGLRALTVIGMVLVALCFVLGVASRSIGDAFPVFVPALERAFAANRGDVTIIYLSLIHI